MGLPTTPPRREHFCTSAAIVRSRSACASGRRFNDKAGIDSYLYYFTHTPPGVGSEYLRAHHAAEIPYAFDNAVRSDRRPYSEVDQKLADQIADYWVNFARNGDPNGEPCRNGPSMMPDTERLHGAGRNGRSKAESAEESPGLLGNDGQRPIENASIRFRQRDSPESLNLSS